MAVAELHTEPMPIEIRWPTPPHYGGLPTRADYDAAGRCEARNGDARCWRRGDHVGAHEDEILGWWEEDVTQMQPDLESDIDVREWWPSSNIAGVGYDRSTWTLEVRFKGVGGITAYRYGNVTPESAAPLLTAKPERRLLGGLSPGAYLSRVFVRRPERHPFVKLDSL